MMRIVRDTWWHGHNGHQHAEVLLFDFKVLRPRTNKTPR